MSYLTGRRADVRFDPRLLLPSARSVLCFGMLYNGPKPYSNELDANDLGWIARYAWGQDYHDVLKTRLRFFLDEATKLSGPFESKICVDTSPLLERSYARQAGLGWIGRNTCLINEGKGSWFFLAEILISVELPPDSPPPDRCGSCTACIDACPTRAIIPTVDGRHELDSRLCISYLTIELRGSIPEAHRAGMGRHVFGCDICQDVCPWNRKSSTECDPVFHPRAFAPPLEKMAGLTEEEFRELFGPTPVSRARYQGFLRNVAVAMGNAKLERFRAPLESLAGHPDPVVSEHARWALALMPSW